MASASHSPRRGSSAQALAAPREFRYHPAQIIRRRKTSGAAVMKLRAISAALTIAAVSAAAIAPLAHAASAAAPYHAPRTPDGQPDLQGAWTNATITPFEREAKYGDRLALTDQEVKALEGSNAQLVADGNKPTD